MSLEDVLLLGPSSPKRVLITGTNGQVRWVLQRTAPAAINLTGLDSSALDIRDQGEVDKLINEISPDIVINTDAYTAVDKAEEESELGYSVNAGGAGNLARSSYNRGARFLYISTDFVFDGTQSTLYLPDDEPNPIGVYGASKLEGEKLVAKCT